MDVITKYVEELSDGRLEVLGMPAKNMPVSMVMLRGTGRNPPTGGDDSGFTMSFEFNGLSRSGVLCGEDFICYRPFKDSPEEVLVEEEFDWGALWGNVAAGLAIVTVVTGAVAYCATVAFTGGASAVFAPYVMGGLTAVGGSWLVVSQAEKDYARGEVSNWTTYANCGLAGSASGALAGYAFCMAPYAAPTLLYGTGAGYMGSMAGLSEEMMLDLAEAALYAVNFSNILVKGSDMAESATGKNLLKDALGEELYDKTSQVSELGAAATVMAGLSNPDYYVKNNQAAHFEQVPRAGEDIVELSNSNIQHIKKHTFEGMAEQAKYLTDEKLANKLNNTSFFNKDWSQKEVIEYTQEAYNTLRSQGKTGLQSTEINGEIINIFIKGDGTFDTAYGVYKYTVDDFR